MAAIPKSGFIALNRFGFGARGDGDLAAAASDPRAFLLSELAEPGAALLDGPGLQKSQPALKAFFEEQDQRRLARQAMNEAAKAQQAPQTPPPAMAPDMTMQLPAGAPKPPPAPPSLEQAAYRAETMARVQRALSARAGFVERLVCFWSNHFCVSVSKGGPVRMLAGAYEREAIRPHVLGRFADMLKAVEQHQAMIFYLDNQQSIGPNSRAGQNRNKGLNENLAREILELHTLGVDGGYTQADVGALARIITGWTFVGREGKAGEPGAPVFLPNFHEPGAQTLLAKTYAQDGRAQGLAALDDLARNPATARHIAAKFARAFVADDPPPPLVARLAKNFTDTGGDLRALAATLVNADEAWSAPIGKLRSPYEFLVSAARATGFIPAQPQQIIGLLNNLGQPLWAPPGPNGYSDASAAWATPEGMKARLDIAARIAQRGGDAPDPLALLDQIAGAAAAPETRQAIARAESRQQGLTLLLMSPEMQRR
ncbi:MAG: DUF1800 family protein [Hyphomicrobiales bacterium]|nr:DUF1800 family protein [Hyphomicrobiales bacterium]